MELCSAGHDEVCFEGGNCPACSKIEDLEAEISDLVEEITALEDKIELLQDEVQDLREERNG